jgi:hypothetical protein
VRSFLDVDKLNLVGLRKVGNVAMAVTDATQDYTKEEQVVGAAAHFLLLCNTFKADPGETFRIAERVIKARYDGRPELIAVEQYMRHELL